MISLSKHYKIRDGHEVELLKIYPGQPRPIVGVYNAGHRYPYSWLENGSASLVGPSGLDLIEVKPKLYILCFKSKRDGSVLATNPKETYPCGFPSKDWTLVAKLEYIEGAGL